MKRSIILLALALVACAPPDIDRRYTEGSYEGFTIGSSGAEAYGRFAQKVLEEGNHTYLSCEIVDRDSVLAGAGAGYGLWKRWDLIGLRDSAFEHFGLRFDNGFVTQVSVGGPPFFPGMSVDAALAALKDTVSRASYDSLLIGLREKDFNAAYDSCMEDIAWDPQAATDSLRYWTLYYPGSTTCADGLSLIFRDRVLVEIHRFRSCSSSI
jgi:hypothetical protein